MTDTELGAVASTYAHADLAIFPLWWAAADRCACPLAAECPNPTKHPMVARGVLAATTDQDFITTFWTKFPRANIGIAAGGNNLGILDIDPRHDGDKSYDRLCRFMSSRGDAMPTTLTQHTGSGGRHLLFTAPDDGVKGTSNAFGKDMPGLDTRGRGGYIVAAPSIHICGQPYRWESFLADIAPWPNILTKLIDPPKPAADPFDAARNHGHGAAYGQVALTNEAEEVRSAPEGTRNGKLNEAAFALGQIVLTGALEQSVVEDELYAAASAAGLHDSEIRKTIASGIAAGKAAPRA